MVDILHKVGIKSSSLDTVYKTLTTREGLSAWWTDNTQGQSKVGGSKALTMDIFSLQGRGFGHRQSLQSAG